MSLTRELLDRVTASTDALIRERDALRAQVERLKTALRRAADEPNIDRARAIADEALGNPTIGRPGNLSDYVQQARKGITLENAQSEVRNDFFALRQFIK
jgi:cell division septum initiation protein DivIVA